MAAQVVIHYALYPQTDKLALLNLLQNHIGGRTGSNDHHIGLLSLPNHACPFGIQDTHNPIAEPDAAGGGKKEKPVQGIVAPGHLLAQGIAHHHLGQRRTAGCKCNIDQLRGACIPPHTLIQLPDHKEEKRAEHCIRQNGFISLPVLHGNFLKAEFKTQIKSHKGGRDNGHHIQ